MLFSKLILLFSIKILHYKTINGLFGRDWSVWTEAHRLIKLEISEKRAIGLHPLQEIKDFDLFTYGLKIRTNLPGFISNDDINIVKGRGVLIENNQIEIVTPRQAINTCGLLIGFPSNGNTGLISNITILWKTNPEDQINTIARPDNGLLTYNLDLKKGHQYRALFFDNIPAKYFKLVMHGTSKKPVNFKVASINKCVYKGRHIITDCGEKLENNKKFSSQPYGVPISIKCPIDCIRTWPCWGYKIYSTDSPICWTATQNFGRWGNGFYTIYKIPKVLYFHDQENVLYNHGIYCRKSTTPYPGYTFDRRFYDFANDESKKLT